MTPTLRPAEQVVVWRPLRGVRPGQVVVYRDRFDDGLRIKRVVAVAHDGWLQVRGDNLALSTASRELGRVDPSRVLGVAVVRHGSVRGWSRLGYHRQR